MISIKENVNVTKKLFFLLNKRECGKLSVIVMPSKVRSLMSEVYVIILLTIKKDPEFLTNN